MQTEINKAKITRHKTLYVEITTTKDDGSVVEAQEEHDNIVHDDLEKAFQKLAVHLVLLTDLREGDNIGTGRGKIAIDAVTPDMFEKFTISSFSIGGGDDEGVTITGRKQLSASKVLNLNSPFQKYEDEMEPYKYGSELAADVQACVYEVEQYLKGKCAAKQTTIEFEPEHEHEKEHETAA
jgi:hypothetical protein